MVDNFLVPNVGNALDRLRQLVQDAQTQQNQEAALGLRREDLGLRRAAGERADRNANRSFDLNLKQFDASQANSDRTFDLQNRRLNSADAFNRSKLEFDQRKAERDAKKGTPTFQNFMRAKESGFEGSFFDFQRDLAAAGATGRVQGKSSAENVAGAPAAIDKASDALTLIKQLRTHPGRASATGFQSNFPTFAGTEVSDFEALLDQAQGKAFLEAFESLKGGGQITEVEGRKATDAIARLRSGQSDEGFLKALDDFESVIKRGAQRQQKLLQGGGTGSQRVSGQGKTRLGIDFKVSP